MQSLSRFAEAEAAAHHDNSRDESHKRVIMQCCKPTRPLQGGDAQQAYAAGCTDNVCAMLMQAMCVERLSSSARVAGRCERKPAMPDICPVRRQSLFRDFEQLPRQFAVWSTDVVGTASRPKTTLLHHQAFQAPNAAIGVKNRFRAWPCIFQPVCTSM